MRAAEGDLQMVDASLKVYEHLASEVEQLRAKASELPALLALACAADEIHGRIGSLSLKRRKLAAVVKVAISA